MYLRISVMKHLVYLMLLCLGTGLHAQQKDTPRLVIGIVIDQMRYDYLFKYMQDYGDGGFKRLLQQGQLYSNAHYSYVPTYTGPGHASIYTGTTPARHGIIANDWYNRFGKRNVYCTQDSLVKTVGSGTVAVGKMSPRNMMASTIGDELRVASNRRSKVYGIALKDRAAILPAGHAANGAYWFDGESGNFVSSSFYGDSLPAWLVAFNQRDRAGELLNQTWNLLLPESAYDESLPDKNPYEGPFKGNPSITFPYDLKTLSTNNYGRNLIRATPMGSTLTRELAEALIAGEGLGKDAFTDMVCVSFSSPDYIGHQFGPDSRELQDCYLRLDRDLEKLMQFAEQQAGKGQVLFFLTADHGGATVPAYLMDLRLPGGYMNYSPLNDSVNHWLNTRYQAKNWLTTIENEQLYLDETAIEKAGHSVASVEDFLVEKLSYWPGVQHVFSGRKLQQTEYTRGIGWRVQQGYMPKRSGNVALALHPNWMEYSRTGTTHGSPWTYDTRIPLVFCGWNIKAGEYTGLVSIEDIAPTLSHLLRVPFPNAASGKIIYPTPCE